MNVSHVLSSIALRGKTYTLMAHSGVFEEIQSIINNCKVHHKHACYISQKAQTMFVEVETLHYKLDTTHCKGLITECYNAHKHNQSPLANAKHNHNCALRLR